MSLSMSDIPMDICSVSGVFSSCFVDKPSQPDIKNVAAFSVSASPCSIFRFSPKMNVLAGFFQRICQRPQ